MGAKREMGESSESRLKPDGTPIAGDAVENHHVDGVAIPGTHFGHQ